MISNSVLDINLLFFLFQMTSIIELPLEIVNHLCTYLTWIDVVMLELAIPNLRIEQCGIHYDFKLRKLKDLIKQFKQLKQIQYKYHKGFKFDMFMHPQNPKLFLQSNIVKAISVLRKLNYYLYLINKVEHELQVKFLEEDDIDIFCSFCETKFLNIKALETHSETIFPKCRVITIEDLIEFFVL
jgi:hypothetical protein